MGWVTGGADAGGLVAGRSERRSVADLQQNPGRGHDADAGHRDEDLGKTVRIAHPVDITANLLTLLQNVFDGPGQVRQDDLRGTHHRDDTRLSVERLDDLLDQSDRHPWRTRGGDCRRRTSAGAPDDERAAGPRRDVQDGLVSDPRPEDTFGRRVTSGQQVADPGGLVGQVVVESGHAQFGQRLVVAVHAAQRVRDGPGPCRQ